MSRFVLLVLLVLAAWLTMVAALSPGVAITLTPQVVMAGGTVWITCRVNPDSRNRRLLYGIANYTSSERSLEGAEAPITWGPTKFERIPCDAGPAYCLIYQGGNVTHTATASLTVAACN